MKKIGLITTVLITILTLTTAAFARGPGGMPRSMTGYGDMNMTALSKLDLSREQTDKMRSLRQTHHKNVMPLRVKSFEKRAELKLLWMQLDPDVSKIKKTQNELQNIDAEIDEKEIDYRLKMRNVLTSEQLSRYLALKSEGRFHQGFGPMHKGKGPHHGAKGHRGRGHDMP